MVQTPAALHIAGGARAIDSLGAVRGAAGHSIAAVPLRAGLTRI